MDSPPSDRPVINLQSAGGEEFQCEVLDLLEFGGREYAVLLKLADNGRDGESLVIMRLLQRGDQAIFQAIEDPAELELVADYIRELTRQSAKPSLET